MKLRQIPRTVKFTILLLLLIGSVCTVTQPSPALAATNNTHATSRPDDLYPQAVTMPDFSKIMLTWLGNGFTRVEGIPGGHPRGLSGVRGQPQYSLCCFDESQLGRQFQHRDRRPARVVGHRQIRSAEWALVGSEHPL